MNFHTAIQTLAGCDSRKVGNNTYLLKLRDTGDTYYVGLKLHGTVILEFHEDRTVVRSGGYRTATTKRRINQYLYPIQLINRRGDWAWNTGATTYGAGPVSFDDGDEIIQLAGDYRYAVRSKEGLVKGVFPASEIKPFPRD